MTKEIATIKDLNMLCENAHLSKSMHFASARRSNNINSYSSSIVAIISVLLASVLFANINLVLPQLVKWISAFLALIAAILSSVQMSFNFAKKFEGHRSIANKYLSFAKKCEYMLDQYYDDMIDLRTISFRIPELHKEYNQINIDAEIFPTPERDYKKAKKQEKHRQSFSSERASSTEKEIKENNKYYNITSGSN
jgi:hypothetical protein